MIAERCEVYEEVMKFENTEVWGFEHAMRGMRNPKNSWHMSDSQEIPPDDPEFHSHGGFLIGPKDMKLAQTLILSGSEHRKFLRQIFVSVDITGPIFWWKEFDTYKVGTVANSCSTMHKIHAHTIDIDSFEIGDLNPDLYVDSEFLVADSTGDADGATGTTIRDVAKTFTSVLESLRQAYLDTKDMRYWKELIRWLPEGWLQKRTVTMNYENLLGMCSKSQRRFHKLTEWSDSFISWARSLPYAQEFIFIDETPEKGAV